MLEEHISSDIGLCVNKFILPGQAHLQNLVVLELENELPPPLLNRSQEFTKPIVLPDLGEPDVMIEGGVSVVLPG